MPVDEKQRARRSVKSLTGEAAIRYAEMGLAVYAPAYHSKIPNKNMSGVEGRTSHTATMDPEVLKAIYTEKPKNNTAIRLDMCEPPLVCIDEDDGAAHQKPDEEEAGIIGEHGKIVFARWCDENGVEMPETWTVLSPTGGRGRLYRWPSGEPMLKTKADVLLRVDMLGAGQGQVLPPSSTKAGTYKWAEGLSPDDMPFDELPELPVKVLKLWRDALESEKDKKNANARKKRAQAKGMDAFESLTANDIEKGHRDETLFKAAYALHSAGMEYDKILAKILEVNAKKCKPPLPESVIEEKVKSATSYPVHAVGSKFMIDRGILYRLTKDGGLDLVTNTPPHVDAMTKDVSTGELHYIVSFARPNKEPLIQAIPPHELFTTQGIISHLADTGAIVTSANAMAVLEWLTECEARRGDDLPVIESVNHMGWSKGNDISPFMPYDEGGAVGFYPDPDTTAFSTPYMKPAGELAEWVETIGAARAKSIPFRAALAASFASPLVGPLRVQPFLVSIWGGSGSGKTGTVKAAYSVWGDPSMLLTASGSPTAFSKLASFLGSFPLVLNELQAREAPGGQKGRRDSFQVVAYQLAEGMDKLTLQRTRKFNAVGKWNLIPIITGEVATLDATSQQGQRNRTIELAAEPFEDQAEGGRLHLFMVDHYGQAGRAYIRALQNVGGGNLRKIWALTREKVAALMGYNHLANNCALLGFADALAEYYVFSPGKKWEECESAGLDLAVAVGDAVVSDGNRDSTRSGIEIMASWMEANKSLFSKNASDSPVIGSLGIWYADHVIINGNEFAKAINGAGLDAAGLRRELKKLGITKCDAGRTTKRERLAGGSPVPCVHVMLDALQDYLDRT